MTKLDQVERAYLTELRWTNYQMAKVELSSTSSILHRVRRVCQGLSAAAEGYERAKELVEVDHWLAADNDELTDALAAPARFV